MRLVEDQPTPLASLDEFAGTCFDAITKLQREAREKDQRIEQLEREVDELEARLERQ